MRRMTNGFGWLAGLLLAITGCTTTDQQNLRPPPQPEQYVLPPQDDPRFSKPVAYPKDLLFSDPTLKKDPNNNTGPNGMQRVPSTRLGGGAGMQ
jgi:hypothetical protein